MTCGVQGCVDLLGLSAAFLSVSYKPEATLTVAQSRDVLCSLVLSFLRAEKGGFDSNPHTKPQGAQFSARELDPHPAFWELSL